MYVEDLFLAIGMRLNLSWFDPLQRVVFDGRLDDPWHRSFICNVSGHIEAGKQLSTNQSRTILKLIARVRHQVVRDGLATDDDINQMLRHPEHRRPLYQSANIPREVRHMGDNLLGFRFKQNDIIVDRIKSFGQPTRTDWVSSPLSVSSGVKLDLLPRPRFDWDYKIWIVPVLRHNITGIIMLINEYRFGLDDAAKTYLRLARDSVDETSGVALVANHEMLLANVCDNPLLAGWMVEVGGGITV